MTKLACWPLIHEQVGARGPKIVKDSPGGPIPEWKRIQMEKEEAERKRLDEEERRKKEYTDQILRSASNGHSNVRSTNLSMNTRLTYFRLIQLPPFLALLTPWKASLLSQLLFNVLIILVDALCSS